MDKQTYIITFDTISAAEANQYAEELRHVLLDATQDIAVDRRRGNPRTQDFGATLVLLLGTPSIVAVAAAIGNWLKLRTSASLTIETPDKKVIAQNISSKNAAKLTELLLTQRPEDPE
jgi:hypothetical protein